MPNEGRIFAVTDTIKTLSDALLETTFTPSDNDVRITRLQKTLTEIEIEQTKRMWEVGSAGGTIIADPESDLSKSSAKSTDDSTNPYAGYTDKELQEKREDFEKELRERQEVQERQDESK
jgi:hypothetical protein